jgi:hypothetical protein
MGVLYLAPIVKAELLDAGGLSVYLQLAIFVRSAGQEWAE